MCGILTPTMVHKEKRREDKGRIEKRMNRLIKEDRSRRNGMEKSEENVRCTS
jgi:hypothetical protein